MGDRSILHVDLNCCYAQVECQARPELRGVPVAVAGKEELRHGIVMARNLLAKAAGVKAADTLADARRKCPGLVVVPPRYDMYLRASRETRRIYTDYTPLVEPFGIDEAWLDVTGSARCLGMDAAEIAREISERTKAELGLMVSVGVSWNKVFAKFGSDYEKPDAVTFIDRANYRDIVWGAPASDLLYVGPATARRLHDAGIETIGQLAHASDYFLRHRLGRNGLMLRDFARGLDAAPVAEYDAGIGDIERIRRSYGNGITFPRDICDMRTARAVASMLAESVAHRMREDGVRARTVSVSLRSALDLSATSRQGPLAAPSNITSEIARRARELVAEAWSPGPDRPLRGLGVRASGLVPAAEGLQLPLFDPQPHRAGMERLDAAVDDLRRRYGNKCVVWGAQALDPDAWAIDAKAAHTVHPVSLPRG